MREKFHIQLPTRIQLPLHAILLHTNQRLFTEIILELLREELDSTDLLTGEKMDVMPTTETLMSSTSQLHTRSHHTPPLSLPQMLSTTQLIMSNTTVTTVVMEVP